MADMRPEHLGETLSAYLDGELDAEGTARVEQLLRDDRSVRDQLDVLRRTVDLVVALPRHRAPGTLAEDLQAHLERSELIGGFAEPTASPEPRRTPLVAILSTAAVFAFVAGGMWFMALNKPDAASDGRIADAGFASKDIPFDANNRESRDVPRAKKKSIGRKRHSENRSTLVDSGGLLASATLEQKLAAGRSIASIRSHSFDNEPVRLHVTSTDTRGGRTITSRLLSRLAKMGVIDAASAPETRSADDARVASLFYRGKAHQNFGEGGGTQILVRASLRQLNELLREISREAKAVSSVKLSSGPLVVHGLPGVRGALAQLGAKGEFAGDPLGALASVLGVERSTPETEADTGANDLATPGSRTGSPAAAATPRPTESGEAPGLKTSRRSRRSAKRITNTASVSSPAASPSTDGDAESYITLVIEIAHAHAPSAPSARR